MMLIARVLTLIFAAFVLVSAPAGAVQLCNNAWMMTSTTGTGTITLSTTLSGYQSFDDCGITDGQSVRYRIFDGAGWELGTGTYTTSGTTLTRSVLESSNSDSAINLSGSATVIITPLKQDIPSETTPTDGSIDESGYLFALESGAVVRYLISGLESAFAASPTFTGTVSGAASTWSGNMTFSGTSANVVLGSNWVTNDGADRGISVASSGAVNITSNVSASGLTIYNTAAGGQARLTLNPGASGVAQIDSNAGHLFMTNTTSNADIIFRAGSSVERARITYDGKLGIGTATPGQTLDVQGAAQFGSGNVNLITSAGQLTGLSSTYVAASTSSDLAGVISDETGSGSLVFGTSPTFTTNVTLGSDTVSDFTGLGLALSTGSLGLDSTGATDEFCLTYEDTGPTVQWQTCGGGGGGKKTIWVPAAAMTAETTTGCAAGTVETATNQVMYKSLDCDAATKEGAQFTVAMPKSWNESTITFRADWTAASGSGDVVWAFSCLSVSNDDPLDAAFGTEVTVTDTLTAAGDLDQSPESGSVTASGTPAENDTLLCRVQRDAAAGGDTLGVDARLLGVRVIYTTDTPTDD